jgi:hypothetical protein
MKKRVLLFALLLVSSIALTPAFAAGKSVKIIPDKTVRAVATQGIPIVGNFANGTFAGTLSIVQFIQSGGAIMAVGSLTGILTDPLGNTVGSVTDTQIQLPATQISSSCESLHIELGSADVGAAGAVVHTDPVALDVSADAVGSILCTITSLLNVPALTFLVVGLLNSVLGILG